MSEWQMPANLMSMATSCGPGSRRSIVVLVRCPVLSEAAYAETVLISDPLGARGFVSNSIERHPDYHRQAMYLAACVRSHTAGQVLDAPLPGAPRPRSERVGQIEFERLEHALEQSAAGGPMLEYRTEPRVGVVDVVGDVDVGDQIVDRRGRVSDFLRRQPQVLHVLDEQALDVAQQTSGFEVLLELGDAIAVQCVDGRRIYVVRRHVSEYTVNSDIGEKGVGQTRAEYRVHVCDDVRPCAGVCEGRVADEHEVQVLGGNSVGFESAHGDRLGGGALGVSEDGQRVIGVESVWVRLEFVLHGENDVVRGREATRALLNQLGRRQHLQRRGARVGPDHVADRRGGRATVETQRVQKQILGGLREGSRRCRLSGSTEDDRRIAPRQRAENGVIGVGGWIAQDAGEANEQANGGDLLISVHRDTPSCSHRCARAAICGYRIFLAEVNLDYRNFNGSGAFSAAS